MKKFVRVKNIFTILQIVLISEFLVLLWTNKSVSSISYPFSTVSKSCRKIVTFRNSRRIPYLETYKEENWGGLFYKTKARWNYKTEYYTSWRNEFICCEGYKEENNLSCYPVCQPACGNGTCIKPNLCICHYGYSQQYDNIVSDSVCIPVCTRTCVHGKCTAPEVCTCDYGYSLNFGTCKPICSQPCEIGSYCSEPDHCSCLSGYIDVSISNVTICKPVCMSKCINGECTAPDTCTCNSGYELDAFNSFSCVPKCEHDCLYGKCTAPNICTCYKGYSLKAPNICEPVCNKTCVMGTCVAPETCKCLDGYGLHGEDRYTCEPFCETECVNGKCTAPDVCTCEKGYRLSIDASMKHVCIPYCETPCEPYGTCTKPNVCTCFAGFQLVNETKLNNPYFASNSACVPICPTDCINGFCSAPATCSCNPGYHQIDDHVCKPICTQNCINGFCSAPETCTCNQGYRSSKNASSNICEPSCEIDCINGYCSAPNECTCNSGYKRIDRNHTNHCEPICNPSCKNGVCTQPDVCNCNHGYKQSAYSANVCDPICYESCGINGICEAPDLCICKKGYHMIRYNEGNVHFGCEPICSFDCGNGTCTAPDLCTCFEGYQNIETGSCEPACTMCNNGTCVAPEVCECDDGFVLKELDSISRSSPEDKSGNESKCLPHCDSCNNGECIAPNECRCLVGFVKVKGVCVNACEDGCGTHGKCIDERRTCECDYGWTGMRCDEPTFCVLILNDEKNRTDLVVEEQNATIKQVLMNNPACSECANKVNNETLCYQMYINDTMDEIKIGCLMTKECFPLKYKDNKIITKLGGIISGVGILLSGAAIITYVLLRKHRNKQINLGDTRSTSLQGLIE